MRRIFREFAAGRSPAAIAAALNAEGIAGPHGEHWSDTRRSTAIRQRGTGLLNNELYVGRLVWNRLRYIKDPSTGRRVSRLNPEPEWIVTEVPELRIVDDALWHAVSARQGEIAEKYANVTEAVREHHGEPAERRTPGAVAAFRPDLLRLLRRPLRPTRLGPLRLLEPRQEGHLREQPDHPAGGPGDASAGRPAGIG